MAKSDNPPPKDAALPSAVADLATPNPGRSDTGRWTVCGLLLRASGVDAYAAFLPVQRVLGRLKMEIVPVKYK